MDAQTTSGAGARLRLVPPMWRAWARFVRHPVLPEARQQFGASAIGEVAQLWLLDVLISATLVVALDWLAKALKIAPPDLSSLGTWGPVPMLLIGALAIPVLEECLFRSWLTGSRRALAGAGLALAAALACGTAWLVLRSSAEVTIGFILIAALLIAPLLIWKTNGGSAQWVPAAFPRLFYLSVMLFGLAHLSNYAMDRPWLLLPFVLPQTIAGTIFGFARVRYGMWANITLHATSNALFLGLAAAGI